MGVVEDLDGVGLGERSVLPRDRLDLLLGYVPPLVPERLTHRLPRLAGIDQLDLALTMIGLAIGDDPEIRGDACVVEHLLGERNDALQLIVLDDPSTDLGLTTTSSACEQR